MVLLELAIQGVRGCSPTARVALKPGYTVLKGPQGGAPPLASLLTAICFPDGRGTDQAYLAPGAKTGRAGVSLQGADGSTWRLVKELGGPGALHKLNPATRAFEVVTQDGTEIGQTLRIQAGMPTRAAFEQLYTLTLAQLPSRRPKPAAAAAKPAALESLSGPRAALSDLDLAEAEARIPQLTKELADAKDLAAVQFRQDELQGELYTLEAKHQQLAEVREKVRTSKAEYDAAPTAEKLNLPADIVERVKRYPAELKRKDEAIKKVWEEREAANALDQSASRVLPLWKDQAFLGAMGAGVALTVLGSYFEGPARYLAMAAIVPWTFAALRALTWLDEKQRARKDTGIKDIFATREKKIMDEFSLSHTQVDTAFTLLQVDSVEDFVTAMGKKAELQRSLGELELALAEMEVDPEFATVDEKIAPLRAELEQVQLNLQSKSAGYFRSPVEVERDLKRFQDAVRRSRQTAAPEPTAAGAAAPTASVEDPAPSLLLLASGLLATDVSGAAALVKDRCGQYLAALTDKKWQGVEFDADGKAHLTAPGKRSAVGEAPARDADVFFVALRMTLVEKVAAKARAPFVIEDCFAEAIDAGRFTMLNRMLKHLGTVTQVLHVTGAGQNAFQPDAVVSV